MVKTVYDFALDILQERRFQLDIEHSRTIKELEIKQAEQESLNKYVKILTDEKVKLETDMADLDRAMPILGQPSDSQT